MRPLYVVVILLLGSLSGCQQNPVRGAETVTQSLAQKLDAILHRQDKTKAVYIARVLELPSRREIYAHDADEPLIPASNLKLFTTSTGLDRFGPDHVFKTYLLIDGDDMWVIGTGDPGVGDAKINDKHGRTRTSVFDDWLAALKKRGISHVKGKVYYAQNCFNDDWVHPSWSRGFLTDWYAAPVTGLTFSDNGVDIEVFPTALGAPARYEVHPPAKNIEVINKTITSTPASTRATEVVEAGSGTTRPTRRAATRPVDIDRAKNANIYTIFGAVTKQEELSTKPVTDPGAFFVDAMRMHFASRGFVIDGASAEASPPARLMGPGMTPRTDKIVAVHETAMKDVLWRINKNSQNLFAEAMSKLNGQDLERANGVKDPKGSWAKGSDAAHAFLRKSHIDDLKIKIVDGSGLSRENRVTARAITDLLATMHEHKYAQTFFDSLAIAGKDGTIRSRMKDLDQRVHAKTGFVGGVRSLSGYVKTRSGKTLCFCIIYNHIPESEQGVKPFEQMQDDACRAMVEGM